jgi:hypothetical protein
MSVNNTKSCPVTGCFCWKNPLHLFAFLALLPWAVRGALAVWESAVACVNTLAN